MPSQYLKILKISHYAIVEALDSTQLSLHSSREANQRIYDLREKLLNAFGKQDKVMIDVLYAFYVGRKQKIAEDQDLSSYLVQEAYLRKSDPLQHRR